MDLRSLSRLLALPGDFLARRLDRNYASLIAGIGEEIRAGRRMLLLCSLFVPMECMIAFLVGVSSTHFHLDWPALAVLCLFPIIVVADPHLWRTVYGEIADDVGYMASLLANLDVLYWLAVGLVTGWILS